MSSSKGLSKRKGVTGRLLIASQMNSGWVSTSTRASLSFVAAV